jgi:hypothetical protein
LGYNLLQYIFPRSSETAAMLSGKIPYGNTE